MQARIEEGCLKLKADTDEEKRLMRQFYDAFLDGIDTDFGISKADADNCFLYIRPGPVPKVN